MQGHEESGLTIFCEAVLIYVWPVPKRPNGAPKRPNGAGHERYGKRETQSCGHFESPPMVDPLNVLELVDIPEPGAPGTGEVQIDFELAPLNLHALLFMRGYFGCPPAPTVVGNEPQFTHLW